MPAPENSPSEKKPPPDPAQAWDARARAALRKVNLGWFLQILAPPLVVSALCGACAVLLLRRELPAFPWAGALVWAALALALLLLLCWAAARRRFEKKETALVRLEAAMGLNNSLTAARQGLAPWPAPPAAPARDGTRWHWPRLLVPPLAALALLALSFILPVSAKPDPRSTPPEQPRSWQDLENSLDSLRENNTVEDEYIEKLEKQIDQLRQEDPQDWFSHSSLEASDELKKAHLNSTRELQRNLQRAERNLNTLKKHGDNLTPAQKERLMGELDQALQQMQQGALKPNKELLDQLGQIDPKNLGNLSQEQLDQLRQNMRQHAQQLQQARQQADPNTAQDWQDELNQQGADPG